MTDIFIAKTFFCPLIKVLLRIAGPVSYTHLDVYKRQGVDCMPTSDHCDEEVEDIYEGKVKSFSTKKEEARSVETSTVSPQKDTNRPGLWRNNRATVFTYFCSKIIW